jgi:GTP:adenosylcobinamide-phosphate guanylyltransferase
LSGPSFDVLVLAGRRDANDEFAQAAGATHRALLDIAGVPMLARVLATLDSHEQIGAILLCSDAPDLMTDVPEVAELVSRSKVRLLTTESTPSLSVLAGIDTLAAENPAGESQNPVLVTTADHALLDHDMLDFFFDAAQSSGADMAVGLVSESLIAKRFPEAKRTYLPFRGGRYSGANLFAFMNPAAREVAVFWRNAEQHRKQPWRMVSAFGLGSLLLFLTRRLDLAGAFRRVSKIVGVEVAAIEMPTAEAAVDVDKLSDWKLANEIYAERAKVSE